MSLAISGSIHAMGPNLTTSLLADGGTPPYMFSVLTGGAGGSVGPSSGIYTSPNVNRNPKMSSDVIQVMDFLGATATYTILVTDALGLFCDVIQTEMNLANGRVYLWDQKIDEPKDNNMFVAVSVLNSKPFGNSNKINANGDQVQAVNMLANLSIDIISRGPEARDRKEEIILALNSVYAQQQQEINSFYIAKISNNFINLSQIDGAAIPYRFNISVNIQYFVSKTKPAPYFDTFAYPVITTEP